MNYIYKKSNGKTQGGHEIEGTQIQRKSTVTTLPKNEFLKKLKKTRWEGPKRRT